MEATIRLVSPRSSFPDQPGSTVQENCMKEARRVEDNCLESKFNEMPSLISGAVTNDEPKKKKRKDRVPLVEGGAAGFHFLFNSGVEIEGGDVSGRAILECVQCGFRTENKASLLRHSNRVHKKQFACDRCDFKTGRKEMLNAHVLSTHNGSKEFKCPNCDFIATQKVELHKHILIFHEKVKTFPCGMCSYMAVRKNHLERHILSLHDTSKQFQCAQCPYKSPRKDKLDRHVSSVHEKLKPFACQFCTYRASRKTNLNKHVLNFHVEQVTMSL